MSRSQYDDGDDGWAVAAGASVGAAADRHGGEDRMTNDDHSADVLERLRTWPVEDAAAGLDVLISHWSDYGSWRSWLSESEAEVVQAVPDERYLRLATGGWADNEAIIAAWRANRPCWMQTWRLSARGGLFIFERTA